MLSILHFKIISWDSPGTGAAEIPPNLWFTQSTVSVCNQQCNPVVVRSSETLKSLIALARWCNCKLSITKRLWHHSWVSSWLHHQHEEHICLRSPPVVCNCESSPCWVYTRRCKLTQSAKSVTDRHKHFFTVDGHFSIRTCPLLSFLSVNCNAALLCKYRYPLYIYAPFKWFHLPLCTVSSFYCTSMIHICQEAPLSNRKENGILFS